MCFDLPSEGDLMVIASGIANSCIRICVFKQISTAYIDCYSTERDYHCMDTDVVAAAVPGGDEVFWCDRVKPSCMAETLVHEMAHLCGWSHNLSLATGQSDNGIPHGNGHGPPDCRR